MYATHDDSDIDLLIVTQPSMIWFVRFFATIILWISGVWRHGEDVAGNFCLSFFVTTDALDFSQISIEDDIYLYYWIYYLKPIFDRDASYERFLMVNGWVDLDEKQKQENSKYTIQDIISLTGVKRYYWILPILHGLNSLIRLI
jgi:hypothetical protein